MIALKLFKDAKKRQALTFVVPSLQFCEDKPERSKENENKKRSDEKKNKTEKGSSAAAKLNELLSSMKTAEDSILPKAADIPKAGGRRKEKMEEKKNLEELKHEVQSKDLTAAVKTVAKLIGDDKKIESELLAKLLGHTDTGSSTSSSDPGLETKTPNLKNIIHGMKIDNDTERSRTRAEYVRETILEQKTQQFSDQREYKIRSNWDQKPRIRDSQSVSGSINLFGEEPLGIFKKKDTLKESHDCLNTWQKLEMKERKLAITHPPGNYFEKMICWTEQKKFWIFPIDNEQGLENQDVDFSEHVFLEQHLEPWCPKRGPIRHFMELVCVGLSKNPYITAQEKKEHILWYQNYFEQKRDILKEVIQQSDEKSESKQLERN